VEPGVINKIKQLHNTGQNLESVTLKSIRPSPSSHIAATGCHYSPLTPSPPDGGCELLCDKLLKIYSKKLNKICFLSFTFWEGRRLSYDIS
jgi:hypothetical protein